MGPIKKLFAISFLVLFLTGWSFNSSFSAPIEQASSVPIKKSNPQAQNSSDLKQSLADFESKLSKIQNSPKEISILELKSDFQNIRSNFLDQRKNLASQNISPLILSRFDQFERQFENQIEKIIDHLEKGESAKKELADFLVEPEKIKIENPKSFRALEFNGQIKKAFVASFGKAPEAQTGDLIKNLIQSSRILVQDVLDLDSRPVPVFRVSGEPAEPLVILPPNSLDFSQSGEVELTENLRHLAIELGNDPLSIFNYVSNNIDYVPYYGSKKGADSTLLEKMGNDFDQASLLIALLRIGNESGANQTPARYRQAVIKLPVGKVLDLLGVEDPIVASTVFEKTKVPYVLYVDQNQTPQFFVLEITYVEAYVDYDYTQGVIQGNPAASKRWVPLVPFLAKFYRSQHLDVLSEMSFQAQSFYENYLNGSYGEQKPIEALKTNLQTYLASQHPDLTLEDIYVQTYRSEEDLEFLPLTLPFEVVDELGFFSTAPENLKHRLAVSVLSTDGSQTLLTTELAVSDLANQELLLEYIAASPADQAVINSFPTIYDVVPLSMVNVKPVLKINGQIQSGGGSIDPAIALGKENKLKIIFRSPQKNISSPISNVNVETIEKSVIAGNAEALAINTDHIAPKEIRPNIDAESSASLANQKLWKTAQNFLYRLESVHDELARIIGGRFTNTATRAVIFSGLDVNYQNSEPYSFSWQGLRVDASSLINYYPHFSSDPKLHQKEFLYIFGLQASEDEASIFKDDYAIESISTVKGLKLINQNQVPGVMVKKISSANENELNSLNISIAVKNQLRSSVREGHIIYIPDQTLTYQSWSGLLYIDLDPETGTGAYIVGEGLNGGYTVCTLPGQGGKNGRIMCEWNEDLVSFLRGIRVINSVSANIVSPTSGQQFIQGEPVHLQINYSTELFGLVPFSWTETENLDSSNWYIGSRILSSKYGANVNTVIQIKYPARLGTINNKFDHIIIEKANLYEIPAPLIKSLIRQENGSDFNPYSYRYEPCVDHNLFSGPNPVRSLNLHPYHHFRISGKDILGNFIIEGDQVNNLDPTPKSIASSFTSYGLTMVDSNGDGNLTAAELWSNNNSVQRWSNYCNLSEPDRNFTAQILLSASYGLTHVLYDTAIGQGFDTTSEGAPAINIYDLFTPKISIKLASIYLKEQYDALPGLPETCNEGGRWWQSLRRYNGGPSVQSTNQLATNYANSVCRFYNSHMYDLIN